MVVKGSLSVKKPTQLSREENMVKTMRMKSCGTASVDTSIIFISANAFITFLFSLSSLLCFK